MAVRLPIYLDHQATTPCDPRVVDAMSPWWNDEFGNAASKTHAFGWRAEQAVEEARAQLASLIGADPREIIFTSGATESNNLAILGLARARRDRGHHVITAQTEHRAVLDPCRALEKEGYRVTVLPVQRDGIIDLERLRGALDNDVTLISIMHANNEIGVIQPLAEIAEIARARDIAFHTDAAQSVGKLEIDVRELGPDLMSLSAHKVYGPKGVGALWVRRGSPHLRLEPLLYGGGHERGLRSGTLPVPLCVGFGCACEIARESHEEDARRQARLSERLWKRLSTELAAVELNGDAVKRIPGNLNVSFLGVEGEALLVALPDVALSAGSACTSSTREPSHVLRALGLGEERALSSLRFGIGRATSEAEIDLAAELVIEQVTRLRALSPVWEQARRSRD
jgi:cysteine desulfurase